MSVSLQYLTTGMNSSSTTDGSRKAERHVEVIADDDEGKVSYLTSREASLGAISVVSDRKCESETQCFTAPTDELIQLSAQPTPTPPTTGDLQASPVSAPVRMGVKQQHSQQSGRGEDDEEERSASRKTSYFAGMLPMVMSGTQCSRSVSSQLPSTSARRRNPAGKGLLVRSGVGPLKNHRMVDEWIHAEANTASVKTMSQRHPVVRRLSTVTHLTQAAGTAGPLYGEELVDDANMRRLLRTIDSQSRSCGGGSPRQLLSSHSMKKKNSSVTSPRASMLAMHQMVEAQNMVISTTSPMKSMYDELTSPLHRCSLAPSSDYSSLGQSAAVVGMPADPRPWRALPWIEAKETVKTWRQDVVVERVSGKVGMDLVLQLYHRVVQDHPYSGLIIDSNAKRMAVLATRAAVCCVVIEKVVDSLTHHQSCLMPYVEILFKQLLVPETTDMIEALGGVSYPVVLQGLGLMPKEASNDDEHFNRTNSMNYVHAEASTAGSSSYRGSISAASAADVEELALRAALSISTDSKIRRVSVMDYPFDRSISEDSRDPSSRLPSAEPPHSHRGSEEEPSMSSGLPSTSLSIGGVGIVGSMTSAGAAAAAAAAAPIPPVPPKSILVTKQSTDAEHQPLLSHSHERLSQSNLWRTTSMVQYDGMPLANLNLPEETPIPTEVLVALMRPFIRKPFFVAHVEISKKAVLLAHQVRSRQLHFNRLAKIFNFTYVHWSKSLLMTVMRAWYKLCIERRTQEQKKRERWLRRRMAEHVRVGIRFWRAHAMGILRTSRKDLELNAEIKGKRDELRQVRMDVATLKEEILTLQKQFHLKQAALQEVELSISEVSSQYTKTMDQVREIDRIGTLLLSTLLVKDPLPSISKASITKEPSETDRTEPSTPNPETQMDRSIGMSISLTPGESLTLEWLMGRSQNEMSMGQFQLVQDSPAQMIANQQQQLVASLHVLVAWANQKLQSEGKQVEDLMPSEATAGSTAGANVVVDKDGRINTPDDLEPNGNIDLDCAEVGVFDSLLDEAAPVVMIPYYKLLVLMKAFDNLDANTPSMTVLRTVKVEEEEVLSELRRAQAERQVMPTQNSDNQSAEVESRVVEVSMLSKRMQVKMFEMGKIMMDCYQHLTGAACPVGVDQLTSRSRKACLLYLAGLLRHYTNWVVRRLKKDLGTSNQLEETGELVPVSTLTAVEEAEKLMKEDEENEGAQQHRGQRHHKYPQFTWPPDTHKTWHSQIVNHQKWIAVSISAVHLAVNLNSTIREDPTMIQQENASFFLRDISINMLEDLLPVGMDRTSTFVGIFHVIEHLFQRLSIAFRFYAVRLDRIVAALQNRPAPSVRSGRADSTATRASVLSLGGFSVGSERTVDGDERGVDEEDEESEEDGAAGGKQEKDLRKLYVTANQFWRMLCDVGLAGNGSCAEDSGPTLHRPAVMGVVEQVVFRPMGKVGSSGVDPSQAHSSQSLRKKRGSLFSGPGGSSLAGGGVLNPVPLRDVKVAGKIRQAPCFSRAIQQSRHVDLRAQRGTICMNLTQFVEAVIRCAHCWQCIRAGSRPPQRTGTSVNYTASSSLAASTTSRRSTGAMPGFNIPAAPAPPATVCYEPLSVRSSLYPDVLEVFIAEHVLPKVLNVTTFFSPFQLSMREERVRNLLVEHQDEIFVLFAKYSVPKEAVGIRGALPPPYSQHITAQLRAAEKTFQQVKATVISPDSSRGQSPEGKDGGGEKKQQLVDLVPRDVGIVGVLTADSVLTMAKELMWIRENCLITPSSLQACFNSLVGDHHRESSFMFFSEFSLFIAAMSLYHIPDPSIPLYEKLEDFLLTKVLVE